MVPLFLQAPPPVTQGPLPILLPVLLGLLAVYSLLPRPWGMRPVQGAFVAALALLTAGWVLISGNVASAEMVLFYAFAGIAVIAGGLLVTQRNPVKAALSFALVVLSTCGLFLLQAAPFLMAATIIIYAGAIIVTFLFVIMLAQQLGVSDADLRSREPLLSCVAGFVLLGALLFVLHRNYNTDQLDGLLDRTRLAKDGTTEMGIRAALGDADDFFQKFHAELEKTRVPTEKSRALNNALLETRATWNRLEAPSKPEMRDVALVAVRHRLTELYDVGVQVRDSHGSLQPSSRLQLSTYSRADDRLAQIGPATEPLRDSQGRPVLPANNVAYLGRSLFSDYLLAVELGGTLLLVATVGAIAIAGRRAEGGLR